MNRLLILLSVVCLSGCATAHRQPAGLVARAKLTEARSGILSVRRATAVVKSSTAAASVSIASAQSDAGMVAASFVDLRNSLATLDKGNMDVAKAILAERQAAQSVEALQASLASAREAVDLANGQASIADAKAEEADKRAQEAEVEQEILIVEYRKKAAEAKAEKLRADREKVRADAEHAHVSKIKNYIFVLLAGLFVFLVQYLPFGWLINPLWSIGARIATSAAAAGFAWLIVARYV